MKNISYLQLFSFILLASCLANCERNTLELPETSENNPVIELDMLVDGTPVSAMAGVGQYFNDTDFLLDQDDVYTFFGTIAPLDCGVDCSNSFGIRIRNFNKGVASFDFNQSISERSYKFKNDAESITDAFLLDLDINTLVAEPKYSWIIDNKNYTQEMPNDLRVVDRGVETEVFATVTVHDESTGLTSFYTEELHLDNDVERVSSNIIVEQIEGDSVALRIQHTQSEDFVPVGVTNWIIEDLSGQNQQPQLLILAQDEVVRLRIGEGKSINNTTRFLEALDGTRTTMNVEIKYNEDQGLIYHEADFEYNILEKIVDGSALALQTFEFVLIDENGISFSSAKGAQPTEALFEITKVEPFVQNDKGQQTVKIDCQFSCTLYADDGTQKNVQNAKATIALATP